MSRYLIVTWDGAGNLVPTLGIARTLVERGHDVRMIGHDTIAERCGDVGARFRPVDPGRRAGTRWRIRTTSKPR